MLELFALIIVQTPPPAIALSRFSALVWTVPVECKKGPSLDATCPLNWSGLGVPFRTATMELSSLDVSACLSSCCESLLENEKRREFRPLLRLPA